MKKKIEYGTTTIKFDLEFAERKTLGIQVHPDSKVFVTAPLETPLEKVQEKVKTKAAWIKRQQEFFLSFHPLTPARKYVNGETHLYLGKQYRLRIFKSKNEEVKLKRGYIEIHTRSKTNKKNIQDLLENWYAEKAGVHFNGLYNKLLPLTKSFYKDEVSLKYRWMQKRWGSCSANGVVTLNNELIKAPKKCIEYVIVHEFCHLAYLNHSKAFYNLLEKHYPKWRDTKYYLEHLMV